MCNIKAKYVAVVTLFPQILAVSLLNKTFSICVYFDFSWLNNSGNAPLHTQQVRILCRTHMFRTDRREAVLHLGFSGAVELLFILSLFLKFIYLFFI